ncbi:hypothetical protein TNCV_781791 [Trichonephila clavipes]|nr:hypothetical protein TNCV_781791 [Trichonephila clavipes]
MEIYCRKTILEIQQLYLQNESQKAFTPSTVFRHNYQCLSYKYVKDCSQSFAHPSQQPRPHEIFSKNPLASWIAIFVDISTNFQKNSCGLALTKMVLDESRSFFRVHTGYFSNIPKCIKAEFIASWGCSQSSVVSSSQR